MSNETTQPTPGPWKYEDTEEIVSTSVEHFLGGPLVIATVMVQGDMQEYEWAANGRLMASAPALRDALAELCDLVEASQRGEYTFDSFSLQPARLALAGAGHADTTALRDERDAYREALDRIMETNAPFHGVYDASYIKKWKCGCGRFSRTTVDAIQHGDGCAYVIARDARARFAKEDGTE